MVQFALYFALFRSTLICNLSVMQNDLLQYRFLSREDLGVLYVVGKEMVVPDLHYAGIVPMMFHCCHPL